MSVSDRTCSVPHCGRPTWTERAELCALHWQDRRDHRAETRHRTKDPR